MKTRSTSLNYTSSSNVNVITEKSWDKVKARVGADNFNMYFELARIVHPDLQNNVGKEGLNH